MDVPISVPSSTGNPILRPAIEKSSVPLIFLLANIPTANKRTKYIKMMALSIIEFIYTPIGNVGQHERYDPFINRSVASCLK